MMTQQTHNSECPSPDHPSAVHEYLEIINSATDQAFALETLIAKISESIHAQRTYLVSIDPLSSTLNMECTWGEGWEERHSSKIINLEDQVCNLVATEGQPLSGPVADIYSDGQGLFPDSGGVFATPVILEGKLAAILVVFFRRLRGS